MDSLNVPKPLDKVQYTKCLLAKPHFPLAPVHTLSATLCLSPLGPSSSWLSNVGFILFWALCSFKSTDSPLGPAYLLLQLH